MLDLNWIIVPFVMVGLSTLLIWGMRRNPRAQWNQHRSEINSDDPPRLRERSHVAWEHRLPAQVIEQRRMLSDAWGADTPDLMVSFWETSPGARSDMISHRQLFVPLKPSTRETLLQLEEMCEAQAPDHVPEYASFLVNYCFMRKPGAGGGDIVIKSFPTERDFAHQFFLLDADGKLIGLRGDPEDMQETFFTEEAFLFRQAMIALSHDENSATSAFEEIIGEQFHHPTAHAWLAHLMAASGSDGATMQRELSLAGEFCGRSRIPRMVRAEIAGANQMRSVVSELRRHAAHAEVAIPQGIYLLCQGLLVLRLQKLARGLANLASSEALGVAERERLERLLGSDQRGAQA
ncbi:hypothetical protein IT570_01065 [Candidatus Sumerlaeota bacterium]|nr:hypothetical protein [Candidatus Sumerlaeota bacterium]